MAEQDSKARNQAFLQQLEKQRLQKPCQRVIDLRGRVPGDCDAYEFAGRVHYLDDRAYLILKQLMDRTQGQYTVGVYEALQRALKKLAPTETNEAFSAEQLVLQRDPTRPQHLRFDQTLQRQDPRIRHITPLTLSLKDVEYRAATVDLTTSSLRISMKRAFTLELADEILVTFNSLQSEAPEGLLSNNPYRISRLDHDTQHSYAVLTRQREANDQLSQWWDDWIQQQLQPGVIELQSELFNLARQFYLRIYSRMLPSPLLWLDGDNDPPAVSVLHIGKASSELIAVMQSPMPLPLSAMMADQQDRLLLVSDNPDTALYCRVDEASAVRAMLAAHQQKPGSRLLCLQISRVTVDPNQHQQELNQLAGIDHSAATHLETILDSLTGLLRINDITAIVENLPSITTGKDALTEVSTQIPLPLPQVLRHEIRRQHQRYVVRTPVELTFNEKHHAFESVDLSTTGIGLQMDGDVHIPEQSRVSLFFPRWQSQSKGLKLSDIPYVVKDHHQWDGKTYLGLERIVRQCRPGINDFFDSVLQRNRDSLLLHHDDVVVSQQSRIFSHLISHYLQPALLFFGMSEDQHRILQAVAMTEPAAQHYDDGFWAALSGQVSAMSRPLKPQLSTCKDQLDFGIYACQLGPESDWMIRLGDEFETPTEKLRFIKLALSAPKHGFFQCKLMPFKAAGLEQEVDLQQQLLRLRQYSGHKVKNIRETFSSLFAVAELHDMTQLMADLCKNSQ
ncbi:MAG: PilZ domain-containing protein [Methylophaga sp.]|nr:PilZ domain-containing protein [Methylophaga sp.]